LLIDTGSSNTLVSDSIAAKANLSVKSRGAGIVGHSGPLKIYTGDLYVTGFGLLASDLEIGEFPPSLFHPAFDGFFGRDLLAHAIFHLDGRAGTFHLFL
jgi:hypothetical protein